VATDEDATSTSSSNATERAGGGARGDAREALARLRRVLDLH